ncbi:Gamma-tubulin complex component [Paragonimus heterotremus]|uniref:Gamma-tubulin complex component n=1 Tax=Paragonimus heterotremus TaxID=100268 RepID=A0A8J4SHW7_9TREM|nr:Gamma-tubulin complex component [Paragonimus heterotremus]
MLLIIVNNDTSVIDNESQLGREHRGAASPTNLPARDDRSDIGGSHTDVNILGSRDLSTETVYSNTQQLTLTRFSLWTQEPRFRLRFLASLCDVCRGKRGGALASEVYAYTLVGDPEIASMVRFMLKNLASTLLHLISLWIYDGQLDDPFQEFFVACNPSVKKERLWHEKYSLRRQMIPNFITGAQASKILLAGKSISFLQHACGEKQNIKSREATRQFLLLGQGDFITQLMDLLDHELSKPATQILAHRLSGVLESAIRTTNAQYEQPEILQRLDVRLLDMSTGDTGWDVFSLDYHVDGPLATIFTDDCRLMYLRAFNFLWRAKRMEFVLSNLWRHQILAARLGHGLNADLQPVLHLSELLGAELRHCVQQLQYYINFEVLECAWDVLVKQIQVATDLDEVIEAHQGFLSSVITRCLLDAPSRQLIGQLRTIFDLILSFTQLHQELNALAYQELSARERYANEMVEATRRGKWGTDGTKDTQEKARRTQFVQLHVNAFQARIRILASSYREMVVNIIRMLCAHPDQNLRFLAEHLNFNGHYYHHGSSFGTGPVGSAGDENSASGGSSTSVRKSSGPLSSASGLSENQRKMQHKFGATGDTKSG